MSSKTKKAIWFSTLQGDFGIVLTENEFENMAYIGRAKGVSEKMDAEEIKAFGGKLKKDVVEEILEHLKSKK